MAQLKVTRREEIGTRKVRRLREKGEIPGVVYGHGEQVVAVKLNKHDIDTAVHHGERLLELDLDGRTENVLIKDVQYDTFGNEILHVDLARVDLHELVEVTVPIVLRGTPIGAEEGGVLHQIAADVAIECMVRAIPDEIRVMVTALKVDDSLQMRDLPLPEGAKLLADPDAVVCNVSLVAEEEEAPVKEEAGPQPEVIGEKKAEEQAEESDKKE